MRYDKNWEDLGSRIREEVDRAVNSQDFQNMAKNKIGRASCRERV